MINLLFTSAGRRSYLIRYFKEALGANGQIHAANSSADSPAFLFADKSVVTPLIYDEEYIIFLKSYCQDHNITAIISLFDIDLHILAKNKKEFESIGVRIVVSDENVIDVCNDKWKTYKFLKEVNINTPITFLKPNVAVEAINNGDINFPVIIKPRWGMGSISIQQADNEEELLILYKKVKRQIFSSYLSFESQQDRENCVIIQEMIQGEEHGLDVINDLNRNYQNTIVKRKLAMRSGETDSAITIASPYLKSIGKLLSDKLQHIANLDVDVFLVDEVAYVLEMNARFGGGYPFSHLAGVDLPKAIIKWLNHERASHYLIDAAEGVTGFKDIFVIKY